MITFTQVSAGYQSILLIALFLTLILSLFLLLTVWAKYRYTGKYYFNLAVFFLLFILLVNLRETFVQDTMRVFPGICLDPPMWLSGCVIAGVNLLFFREIVLLRRAKEQMIDRNSIKEAMDMLPGGICYFNANGTVKLCNLQMYRLFRSIAQKDLQKLSELQQALEECGPDTGIICLSKERGTYLFPSGRAWQYREAQVTDKTGRIYTEVVFSEITEQYEKNLELKKQTKILKEISRKLKRLSDNVLILTKEKEVLAAKTKLHDQMGAGLTAVRQMLQQEEPETAGTVKLLRQAVSAIKNDNEYPPEKSDLAKFLQDAETIGVSVDISGVLPACEEQSFVFLTAMRECLANGVRHAGASRFWIKMKELEDSVSIHITNDGAPPEREIVPKGGLRNLVHYVLDCGGKMDIQWKNGFALTVTLPKEKEGTI